jgi:hypothetical protein
MVPLRTFGGCAAASSGAGEGRFVGGLENPREDGNLTQRAQRIQRRREKI